MINWKSALGQALAPFFNLIVIGSRFAYARNKMKILRRYLLLPGAA
jgi:hypothetical protein